MSTLYRVQRMKISERNDFHVAPLPSISLIEAFRKGTKLARQRVKGKEYRGNGVGLFFPSRARCSSFGLNPGRSGFHAATPTVAKLVV